MRVLVCGGRRYENEDILNRVLDELDSKESITTIISGGSTGADRLAEKWAERNFRGTHIFRADWARFGKSAGPERNRRMLDQGYPDLVLVFPGGAGTRDMARISTRGEYRTIFVKEDGTLTEDLREVSDGTSGFFRGIE